MRSLRVLVLALLVLVGSVAMGWVGPSDDAAVAAGDVVPSSAVSAVGGDEVAVADLTPLKPARLLDTRAGSETIDGGGRPNQPIVAGASYTLAVAGRGGVPRAGVSAVAINITTTKATGRGHVTVYPCGTEVPNASNVNLVPGNAVANSAIAKLSATGTICVYAHTTTDVIVDVTGWVAAGSDITPLAPARLMDSRAGSDTVDGGGKPNQPVASGVSYTLAVTGRGGVPKAGVSAVAINITTTGATGRGHVTIYPCGTEVPNASNVNLVPGNAVANSAVAKLGFNGTICVYAHTTTDIIIDVTAWAATTSDLTPLVPARLLDSRIGQATVDGAGTPNTPVAGGSSYTLQVTGRGGVPKQGVSAVTINITTTGATGRGHVTVYPCGTDVPNASNVNLQPGNAVANSAIAKLGNNGTICIYAHTTTNIIVDVTGWNTLGPNQPDNNVTVQNNNTAPITTGGPGTGKATIRTSATVQVGGLIVTTTKTGHPYYGQVTAKAGQTVTTEEVSLAQIIPNLDIRLEVDGSTGKSIVAEGIDNVSVVGAIAPGTAIAPKLITVKCGGSASVVGVSNVTFAPGHFVLDGSLNLRGLDWARVGWNPTLSAEVNLDASAKASCDLKINLPTIPLPQIQASIGPVPVWVTQEFNPVAAKFKVSASAAAKQSLKVSASAFMGVNYNNGSWTKEASVSFNATTPTSLKAQASVSMTVPELTYKARLYGLTGFDVTISPNATLTFKPLETKYLTLVARVDATIGVAFELNLKLKKFKYGHTFGTFTPWGPKEVWSKSRSQPPTTTTTTVAPTPFTCTGSTIPQAECSALATIFNRTGGPNWLNRDGWLSRPDPCTWEGVTCSAGHVRSLGLYGFGLVGDLPSEVANLTELEILGVSDSYDLASIPDSIGNLTKLRGLHFSDTGVSRLPPTIGNLTNLEMISAAGAALLTLPDEIGNLTNLEILYLPGNRLETLPDSMGNLTNLTDLGLDSNKFTTIPPVIGRLTKLKTVYLDNNQLSGDISVAIAPLAAADTIERIYLGGNGCLTASDPVVKEWLDNNTGDFWQDGC